MTHERVSAITKHGWSRDIILPLRAAATANRHIEYTMTAVAQLSMPPLRGKKYPWVRERRR